MSSDCGCKDCKRVREHVASLLPFKVLEAADGKPLRISGIAMAAGFDFVMEKQGISLFRRAKRFANAQSHSQSVVHKRESNVVSF